MRRSGSAKNNDENAGENLFSGVQNAKMSVVLDRTRLISETYVKKILVNKSEWFRNVVYIFSVELLCFYSRFI